MEQHLSLNGWDAHIGFSACHILLRHEKCSHIHGHSYCIHLRIFGRMDEDSMLSDFGAIKSKLRGLAEELDHRILVPTANPDIKVGNDPTGQNIVLEMAERTYSFPRTDVVLLPLRASTVEELSRYILGRFVSEWRVPENVDRIELGIEEGRGQGAWASMDIRSRAS